MLNKTSAIKKTMKQDATPFDFWFLFEQWLLGSLVQMTLLPSAVSTVCEIDINSTYLVFWKSEMRLS